MRINAIAAALIGCATISPAIAQQPPAVKAQGADPAELTLYKATLVQKEAQNGQTAFADVLAQSEASIRAAAGARVSSEKWTNAQTDLASLDASRFACVSALEEIDRLLAVAKQAGSADADKIAVIRADVAKLVNDQNSRIAALRRLLPSA